jgi:hypothetical protein
LPVHIEIFSRKSKRYPFISRLFLALLISFFVRVHFASAQESRRTIFQDDPAKPTTAGEPQKSTERPDPPVIAPSLAKSNSKATDQMPSSPMLAVFETTVASAQEVRQKQFQAADAAYKATVAEAFNVLQEKRKKRFDIAMLVFDGRIKEITQSGDLDKALKIRDEKTRFVKASVEEDQRLAQRCELLIGMALPEGPPGGPPNIPNHDVAKADQNGRIDLLHLFDSKRDGLKGHWTMLADGLVSDAGAATQVRFPYRPPEEYDYQIEFTRLSGDFGMGMLLSKFGNTFKWGMRGPRSVNMSGIDFGSIITPPPDPRMTLNLSLENWRRYACRVEVRKDVVKVFLDNKPILSYATDYKNIGAINELVGDRAEVGLVTWYSTVLFHKVEVVEKSGHGTIQERK